MKSLLAVAVLCRLLAVNHAASCSSNRPKLNFENEASSSSQSKADKNYASCLMHFVDKDLHPHRYIANGGLISYNKILTTRDFLQSYEKDITERNLTVFSSKWKTNDPLSKVNGVHIDYEHGSQLAVASLAESLRYNEFMTNCAITYQHSKYIPKEKVIVSGWRYTNHIADSKVMRKDLLSTLNRREENAHELKQESYYRLSFVDAAANGEYKDRISQMHIGDAGALVFVNKVIGTEEKMLLLAIASVVKQVYITLSSSKNFIRPLYANQD